MKISIPESIQPSTLLQAPMTTGLQLDKSPNLQADSEIEQWTTTNWRIPLRDWWWTSPILAVIWERRAWRKKTIEPAMCLATWTTYWKGAKIAERLVCDCEWSSYIDLSVSMEIRFIFDHNQSLGRSSCLAFFMTSIIWLLSSGRLTVLKFLAQWIKF